MPLRNLWYGTAVRAMTNKKRPVQEEESSFMGRNAGQWGPAFQHPKYLPKVEFSQDDETYLLSIDICL